MTSVISYGIDYVRFAAPHEKDVLDILERIPYVDIMPVWHHGKRFVDVPGKSIELIRMFECVETFITDVVRVHPVHRLDVYVDLQGDLLKDIDHPGTVIMNYGRIETVYSHNLANRGDHVAFGRAYDAQSAGHYPESVTRFEIEMKRELCVALVNHRDGFIKNPVEVALHWINEHFGYKIHIDGLHSVELKGVRKRLAHSRERFYSRYGANILIDMESMGFDALYKFVLECVIDKERSKRDATDNKKVQSASK